MAARIAIDILYIYDESVESLFHGITAIKLVNGKIEEILFKVQTRIEKRNDIDFIVKKHDAITLMFLEKDIILRIAPELIRVYSAKRSRGVAFEIAKSQMAKISLLGGAKANVYMSTRSLGPSSDSLIGESDEPLPNFISLLSREEVDAEYEERRKKREERNTAKPSSSLPTAKVPKSRKVIQEEQKTAPVVEQSKEILERITKMDLGDTREGEKEMSGSGTDDETDGEYEEDEIIAALKEEGGAIYRFEFVGMEISECELSASIVLPHYYEMKTDAKKNFIKLSKVKGSVDTRSYFRLSRSGDGVRYFAKIKK